jgi:1,4-alpha-glucan branching enzyme
MGSEFGQSKEWNHDASLDWHLLQYQDHSGLQSLVRDLNRLYRSEPVFSRGDLNHETFRWLNCTDGDNSTISFLRLDPGQRTVFLVVGNFTPVPRSGYRVGVPHRGYWTEMMNTNATCYGGDGTGNLGGCEASDVPCDGQGNSLVLTLPGLSTLVFKWTAQS